MVGSGANNQLSVDDQVLFPHSLGIFFSALTQWLGFPNYGDEGKVQGLAPYGEPRYLEEMHKMVRLLPNGQFELDLKYFVHHAKGVDMTWENGSPTVGTLYSDEVIKILGEPRNYGNEYTQHHKDVAASMQAMLEEAEFHIVRDAAKRTGKKVLCLAGGVALNSSFNGKILPGTDFEDIYIQPAAGDAGTAIGAAYYVFHQVLGKPRCFEMTHSYTGPNYSNAQIEAALKERNLSYETLDDSDLPRKTARDIAEGNVVGWFQGAAEWGPRALGNRSIVADPRRNDMKDILNARIKRREAFRPFAPSIMQEHAGEYFEQNYPDPFMLKVYKVREEKRAEIPAVTHVDGTGRLQTVDKEVNSRYWELINAFGEQSGTPVVLNTSFNDNEPIVCSPDEAINCFERTHMDVIVLGNYRVKKN
jgi:carbamoyltransferase